MTVDWPTLNLDDSAHYRICAQGVFNPSWLDMLSGEWVIAEHPAARSGTTTLVGRAPGGTIGRAGATLQPGAAFVVP
jgi:hypothetical protein